MHIIPHITISHAHGCSLGASDAAVR